ncbi:hypothetical protein KSMBR1_3646 [Candidatus Kuenenia stuttgartiensis]|uniref:Adenosine 5'-phosphosulfate reductase n=1 Tax=Kuenenia stuttgartiensis TaxID=174633 RepID=A0A2C9CJM8_KUEST|nr:hypothetical protein KSMBR1_3646 [Candidatus Kuenenia stuttgartiensis]
MWNFNFTIKQLLRNYTGSYAKRMEQTMQLDIISVNQKLRNFSAVERIQWAVDNFGMDAILLSSMQKTASVLMHYFYSLGLENYILFIDTGYHFAETLQLRDEFITRYKLNMVTLYPDLTIEQQEKLYGKKLYQYIDGQKECCRLRKEAPYLSYMKNNGLMLSMVGLRQTEGGKRSKLEPLLRDPRIEGYALHPLFDWSDEQIESYLLENDIPIHPLHNKNYPSIGCECCTTPVRPGENPRAGRWRHLNESSDNVPKYCNINFSDGSGI